MRYLTFPIALRYQITDVCGIRPTFCEYLLMNWHRRPERDSSLRSMCPSLNFLNYFCVLLKHKMCSLPKSFAGRETSSIASSSLIFSFVRLDRYVRFCVVLLERARFWLTNAGYFPVEHNRALNGTTILNQLKVDYDLKIPPSTRQSLPRKPVSLCYRFCHSESNHWFCLSRLLK